MWPFNRDSRRNHRYTALNCKYYYGDNGFDDEGYCPLCEEKADELKWIKS